MIGTFARRNVALLSAWIVAVTLALSIVACGAPMQSVKDRMVSAAALFEKVCPQGVETPACVDAAGKIRTALTEIGEARKAPTDQSVLRATVAVDEALRAVDALRPAELK